MRGRVWLKYFTSAFASERGKYPEDREWKDAEWTALMRQVMKEIGNRIGCHVVQRSSEKGGRGGEYLNVDAIFIDDAEYDPSAQKPGWDPFVLPRAAVELENTWIIQDISYCLWKILCVRAPIRVLICYQNNAEKVEPLIQHLEDVIWEGSLMKGTDGDLLVIVGAGKGPPDKYFSVFEWRNDKLEQVKGLQWPS